MIHSNTRKRTRDTYHCNNNLETDPPKDVLQDTIKQKVKGKADVPTNTLPPQDLTAFWDKTRLSIKSSIDALSDRLSPIPPTAEHVQVIFILIQTKTKILYKYHPIYLEKEYASFKQ